MRIATFNVLADSYTKYGDYRHAPTGLMLPGARTNALVRVIGGLNADVVGLQEVEQPLVDALNETGQWNTFWSQKQDAPDGCLTLARKKVAVDEFETHHFSDGSGHVMQMLKVGGVVVANTHIKWELPSRIAQASELLARVGTAPHAVLLGDWNDRPGEPARKLVADAGFKNVWGDEPTAYIANREGPAAIDLLAIRGLRARPVAVEIGDGFDLSEIPSRRCPSDHIPVLAQVTLP
jgi:hypothetical protein